MDKTSYRLAQINAYGTKERNEQQAKQNALLQEIADYENKIHELQPRIAKLIKTANACIENGISIANRKKDKYEDNDFLADMGSHKLGFYWFPCRYDTPLDYVGCQGGGWAGDYVFKTNGFDIIYERQYEPCKLFRQKQEPVEKKYKRCATKWTVEHFDEFESKFYAYVDKVLNA